MPVKRRVSLNPDHPVHYCSIRRIKIMSRHSKHFAGKAVIVVELASFPFLAMGGGYARGVVRAMFSQLFGGKAEKVTSIFFVLKFAS